MSTSAPRTFNSTSSATLEGELVLDEEEPLIAQESIDINSKYSINIVGLAASHSIAWLDPAWVDPASATQKPFCCLV